MEKDTAKKIDKIQQTCKLMSDACSLISSSGIEDSTVQGEELVSLLTLIEDSFNEINDLAGNISEGD